MPWWDLLSAFLRLLSEIGLIIDKCLCRRAVVDCSYGYRHGTRVATARYQKHFPLIKAGELRAGGTLAEAYGRKK